MSHINIAIKLGQLAGKHTTKSANIPQLALQQFMAPQQRREFTEDEKKKIEEGESRWLPRIFQSYGTPAHEMLASPVKSSVLPGALGGLLSGGAGAVLGAGLGHAAGIANGSENTPTAIGVGALAGGGLGALAGGGLGAFTGYHARKAENEGIKDIMRRVGRDATKRDLLSDPVYNSGVTQMTQAPASSANDALTTYALMEALRHRD